MSKLIFGILILCGIAAIAIYSIDIKKNETINVAHLESVQNWRKEKADAFKFDDNSPLTQAQKTNFRGLNYYDIDSKYLIHAEFMKSTKQQVVKMNISDGSRRDYVIFGTANFSLDGEKHALTIYKSAEVEDDAYLFLPFYDLTTAEETYGSGRYVEPTLVDPDHLEIDFNLAYNPYCAYNAKYRCPIPPKGNQVTVAIKAGEKNPDFTH